jgi:AcrR family transcriptional regulator
MTAGERQPVSTPDMLRERVMETAARLFASLSYDGTSTQMIADSAGVDVATVTELAGSKRDLYVEVMGQAALAQRAMFEAAFARYTPDRAGIHLLMDCYLDFCVDHPEVPALWMHRWQSDASDITELESLYVRPMFDRLIGALQPFDFDVDLEYAIWTVHWSVRGFCLGGVLDTHGRREGPRNTVFLRRFRAHLHQLVDRMLQLDR